MRFKTFLLTLTLVLLGISAAMAQDNIYVAYTKSGGVSAAIKPAATDAQLKYDAATGVYSGTVTLEALNTPNSAVGFYAGPSAGTATEYYRMYNPTTFNFTNTDVVYGTIQRQEQSCMGNWFAYNGIPDNLTFPVKLGVKINFATNTITYTLGEEEVAAPSYFNVFVRGLDATYPSLGKLQPESEGSMIYTGEFTTTFNDARIWLSDKDTYETNSTIGQVITGTATSKDIALTAAGQADTLQMGYNNVATIFKNQGTYSMNFDYNTMELVVTLKEPYAPEANYVTLNISGDVPSPYSFVTVTDAASTEPITIGDATVNVPYTAGTSVLNIGLNDAAKAQGYTITVSSKADAANYQLKQTADGWSLTPAAEANGYVFNVNVAAPTYNATFKYTGINNGYLQVQVEEMVDNDNDVTSPVPVNSANYNFKYTNGTMVFFRMSKEKVADGYSFTLKGPKATGTTDAEQGAYSITSTSVDGAIGYAMMLEKGAEGYVFTVDVAYTNPTPVNEIKVCFGTQASNCTPAENDPVCTRLDNGTYEGSFDVQGSGVYFRFYSVQDGVTTYYGCQQIANNELLSANRTLDFSKNNPESFNMFGSSTNKNMVGAFSTWRYPGAYTGGQIRATLDLDPNVTNVKFLFIANEDEPDTQYYFYGGTASDQLANVASMVQSTVDKNVYEYTYKVNNTPYYFFVSTNQKMTAGTNGNWRPQTNDREIKFTYDTLNYKANWVAGLDPAVIQTAGNMKFRFNVKTYEMEIEYLDEIEGPAPELPTEGVFVLIGANYYGPYNPNPAKDAQMTLNADGYYESPAIHVKKNNGVVFYKWEADTVNYIAPLIAMTVPLAQQNPFVSDFPMREGTIMSGWRIANFVNPADTEGDVVFQVNPTISRAIFTQQVGEAAPPKEIYIWGNTEGGSDAPYRLTVTLKPSAENPNVYTATYNVPKCGNFVYPSNGEFDPEDNDPDHGWWFFISESTTLSNARYSRYQGGYENRFFNFDDPTFTNYAADNTYTLPVFKNGLNDFNFIAMTPGNTLFEFDIEKMELTLTNLANDLSNEITLEFTGDVSAYNVAKAVVVIDMASIDDDADDPLATGMLPIYDLIYNFRYENASQLLFATQQGYSIEITSDYEGENPPYQLAVAPAAADDDAVEAPVSYTLSFGKEANGLTFAIDVTNLNKPGSGVDIIGADDAEAVYYDIHGRRVVNPERGIYIKVVNGRSVKVVK